MKERYGLCELYAAIVLIVLGSF